MTIHTGDTYKVVIRDSFWEVQQREVRVALLALTNQCLSEPPPPHQTEIKTKLIHRAVLGLEKMYGKPFC